MTKERRYDEREVGRILERVAELHAADAGEGRAMTQGEIEEVVTELGISKALVTRAVSELSVADSRNRSVWWLGGKTDLMFEQRVAGRIDDATLTRMLEVVRRSLGDPGALSTEGSSRMWSPTRSTRTVHFTVVELEGESILRLEERMPMDSRSTVGGSAGAGWFLGIMTVVPLKALVAKALLTLLLGPTMAVGAGVGWLIGRRLWRRTATRREDQLRRAFAEILAIAGEREVALEGAERPALSAAE